MKRQLSLIATLILFTLLLGARLLSGQDLAEPRFRPSDGKERAARILDSVQAVDRDLSATRRVFADTTSGTLAWIEFEPAALARAQSGDSPEAAASGFLAAYGARLFGTELPAANLELVRSYSDGPLTHFRYAQRLNGRRVYGGDLLVHVTQVSGRYAVQSLNGRIYPGVDVPADPAVRFGVAQQSAVGIVQGARAAATQDSTPIVVPQDDGYRLAYVVNVLDPGRGLRSRYVDAVSGAPFAETPGVVNFGENASRRSAARDEAQPIGPRPGDAGRMDYVSTTGTDALDNPRGPFNVWRDSPTQFRMASNGWPGVTQIEIRDFGGTDLRADDCSSFYPYADAASIQPSWPSDADGKEEVSAVANMGETLRYYNTKFGRRGIRDDITLSPARACVHGTDPRVFNAAFYPSNSTWGFVAATDTAKASAAAQDVVTHEMQHGVTYFEANPGFGFETLAVNEAMSDYFGTRHRGSSCLAFDALGFCLREINSDLTVAQRQGDPNCRDSAHCVGVAFSSALWRTASTEVWFGNDVDWGLYNGLRFYMPSTVMFVTGREAVVRTIKDRLRQGLNQTPGGIVFQVENEFYRRGIGPEPVVVSVPYAWICNEWRPQASGTGTRSFALWFEAGVGFFNDGSVDHRFYNVSLGTFTATSLPMFTSSQLGGHRPDDGHDHAFRFRFTDVGPAVGYLDYFAGGGRSCGIQQVAANTPPAPAPKDFAVRQAIETAGGLVSSRTPPPSGGQASPPIESGRRLSDAVRRSGITALEVDVPSKVAGQRLEVRIFDLQGRHIRTLAEDNVPAGRKTVVWDRLTATGATAPAGVYVVAVRYGSTSKRTRFVIPRSR